MYNKKLTRSINEILFTTTLHIHRYMVYIVVLRVGVERGMVIAQVSYTRTTKATTYKLKAMRLCLLLYKNDNKHDAGKDSTDMRKRC